MWNPFKFIFHRRITAGYLKIPIYDNVKNTVRVLPKTTGLGLPYKVPGVNLEPHSLLLYYRNFQDRDMAQDLFVFGAWCGTNNVDCGIRIPGDGSLRIIFGNDQDLAMFSLSLSDILTSHKTKNGI